MTRSTDITSFTEHRKHLRDHMQQVRKTGRPLYITTNGQTDAVLLSPAAYDSLAEKAELADSLATLEHGMAEARAGRGIAFKDALLKVASDLGLQIEP